MISAKNLIGYLNELLNPAQFPDLCPNGLQVEGKPEIQKIMAGVTASQEFLDRAVEQSADAILVHHGYFWKGEEQPIVGIKHKRLKTLLTHDINLIAYHLCLDVHPIYGNNIQLAKHLGLQSVEQYSLMPFLTTGELSEALTPDQFSDFIENKLLRKPLWIEGKSKTIKRIAWCTGAARDLIPLAAEQKVDAYITGEISEKTVYEARELGVHLFVAGHYATERYGIQSLGEHIAERFKLDHKFVEIDSPV